MTHGLRLLFWLGFAMIVASTLSPIELRPETGLPPEIERFGAFLVVSALWTLAYPRQRWIGLLALAMAAGVLEALQGLAPGRHGRLLDAEVKTAGVVAGAVVGLALGAVSRRRRASIA